MKKILLVLSVFFVMMIPTRSQSRNLLNDSTVKELKIVIEDFKNRFHTPSIVVAIIHEKEIIFHESLGYIDLENKIAATIDSKYPILSVTKTFTATMLMQLLQRNIVDLDDDVKKYVPEFRGNSDLPGKSGTTLFQLATHTSGLPRNTQADINFTKQVDSWLVAGTNISTLDPATNPELLKSLKFIKKEYPEYQFLSPNDRHYSNLGYSLLGIALERVAKTDYADYIINNICKPLKMNNSGFGTETSGNNIIAKGYYYTDSTRGFIKAPVFKANAAIYAGGMFSTARDLAKYISFQFDQALPANKILSEKNRAMMQALKIGWKPSYPFVLHEGAMVGYRCQVIFNPEIKVGWVILTNTSNFDFSGLNNNISRLILPVYNKKPVTDLKKYTGTYILAGGYDSLKIYLKNDSLYSTYLQDVLFESPLISTGNNKFKGQGKGNYSIGYDFISNDKSEINVLNLGQLMWEKSSGY